MAWARRRRSRSRMSLGWSSDATKEWTGSCFEATMNRRREMDDILEVYQLRCGGCVGGAQCSEKSSEALRRLSHSIA